MATSSKLWNKDRMPDSFVNAAQIDAYLNHIGISQRGRPDDSFLRTLQQNHLRTVPFENLSIHLGETITLEPHVLLGKILDRKRGGFCYELNGAFATLLTALGYRVTVMAARVFLDGVLTLPFDHLALRVETEELWLVDVGFGQLSEFPLRLDDRGEQIDPGGTFAIRETADGDLDVYRNGKPQYRLETRPRVLADFEMACWWNCTSPKSHFTKSLVCSRLTETGRITLTGNRLITTDAEGRHEKELPTDEAVIDAYRDHFGITVPRVPVLRGQASQSTSHGTRNPFAR